MGESEKNIRELFAEADAEYAERGDDSELHIIIFDEIDSVRSGGVASGEWEGASVKEVGHCDSELLIDIFDSVCQVGGGQCRGSRPLRLSIRAFDSVCSRKWRVGGSKWQEGGSK